MKSNMTVTYISHSGFLVETASSYLLFDYWKGTIPPLSPDKKLYVFCSHIHHDHYSKEIFGLEGTCRETYYVLSEDIKKGSRFWKVVDNPYFVGAGGEIRVDGAQVEAFESTDEGVAFLVTIDGHVIYHAGDLHWWDWPGEPDEENEMMRIRYCNEIRHLEGRKIDAAFVVLDPRQEESGGLGMEYYVRHVEARYIFPMHFWEDYKYINDFYIGKASLFREGQFVMIGHTGESFDLDF